MEIAKHKGKRENRLRAGQDTCSLCRIEAERRARYALYAMELVQFHGRYAAAYYSRSSLEASTLYRCIYIYICMCMYIYSVYVCLSSSPLRSSASLGTGRRDDEKCPASVVPEWDGDRSDERPRALINDRMIHSPRAHCPRQDRERVDVVPYATDHRLRE